jgi:hypothetical protein
VLDPQPYVKLLPINNMLDSAIACEVARMKTRLVGKIETNFILKSLVIFKT